MSLYGAVDGSSNVVTIEPGKWVTVSGRGLEWDRPRSSADSYSVRVAASKSDWYQQDQKEMQDLTPVYGSVVSNAVKWDGSNI